MPFDISGVPIAKNGDVISPEFHNSLRSALIALASQLGAIPAAPTITTTPHFSANDGGPNWNMVDGAASLAAGETAANGWFPLQVPHDMRIQSLAVFGNRVGTFASFQVKFLRQTIVDGSVVSLVTLQLNNASTPFEVRGTVNVAGAGPAALEEYRRIDNENYNYLIVGRVLGAAGGAVAQVTAVQLVLSRA